MKEWKLNQIRTINRFDRWLEVQIANSCKTLYKCADGSHTTDILEDRILQLRRMKDALPQYLLSNGKDHSPIGAVGASNTEPNSADPIG
jgi:hypothetical protein